MRSSTQEPRGRHGHVQAVQYQQNVRRPRDVAWALASHGGRVSVQGAGSCALAGRRLGRVKSGRGLSEVRPRKLAKSPWVSPGSMWE